MRILSITQVWVPVVRKWGLANRLGVIDVNPSFFQHPMDYE